MTKKILTALSFIFLFHLGHAQFLGLKGGLNFSSLSIDDVDDENLRFGYHFGAYINLPIGDNISIQPEVLYTTKGASADYETLDIFEGESTFQINYIDVPVLLVIDIGDFAEVHAGPYFGYLTDVSIDLDGSVDQEIDLDRDNFSQIDWGISAGAAIDLGAFQVGARYNLGLQEIEDSATAELFLGDARNSVVQAFLALRIGDYE